MPSFAVTVTTSVTYHVNAASADEAESLAVLREEYEDRLPETDAESEEYQRAMLQAAYVTDSWHREADAEPFCPGDDEHEEHDPDIDCETLVYGGS